MYSWVDIKKVFPGIKGLFVHTVNIDTNRLISILGEYDFKVVRLNGQEIVNEDTFLDTAALSFMFPDYFGHNWDAWNDSLGDFGSSLPSNRVAIIWESADHTISNDLQVFIQAVIDLVNLASQIALRTINQEENNKVLQQIEIFLLGQQNGFQKLEE